MSYPPEPRRPAKKPFGFRRYSSVELLGTLIALIAVTPFVEDFRGGDFIEMLLTSLVLTSAMLAVGGARRTFLAAAALLVPALLARWLHHTHPHLHTQPYYLAIGIVFIGFVVTHLLGFVLRSSRVDAEVLCAGISAYLLLGLLWSLGYTFIAQLNPAAFSFANPADAQTGMNGFNAFYFSFVTLTTVGFGDFTPLSKGARTLAAMEAITGTFYLTVLIARLVSMYSPSAKANPEQPPLP